MKYGFKPTFYLFSQYRRPSKILRPMDILNLISSWCNVFNLIQLSCSNIDPLILRKRYKAHTKMNKTLSLVRRKCKLSEIKSRGNLMALSVINLTVTWHCTHRFFNDMEDKEPWSFVINLSQSKSFDRTSFVDSTTKKIICKNILHSISPTQYC